MKVFALLRKQMTDSHVAVAMLLEHAGSAGENSFVKSPRIHACVRGEITFQLEPADVPTVFTIGVTNFNRTRGTESLYIN